MAEETSAVWVVVRDAFTRSHRSRLSPSRVDVKSRTCTQKSIIPLISNYSDKELLCQFTFLLLGDLQRRIFFFYNSFKIYSPQIREELLIIKHSKEEFILFAGILYNFIKEKVSLTLYLIFLLIRYLKL